MARPLPHYYSSLGPFRRTFLSGSPVLTYHHVGPRPRGVRLKGLYVSPKLFARQIGELRAAGFVSASLDALGVRPSPGAATPELRGVRATLAPTEHTGVAAPGDGRTPPARIFITFDDGFRDVFEQALPVLQANRFCAIQFIVAERVGKTSEWQQRAGDVAQALMDAAQVRQWLAAGQQIGSHTRTHPWLTRLAPAAAREEITASRKALEDRFGIAVEHFCYPYGDWNESVRDLVMAAGYKTACTTQTGINTAEGSPFELKRFTARYPSRNLKALWARLRPW